MSREMPNVLTAERRMFENIAASQGFDTRCDKRGFYLATDTRRLWIGWMWRGRHCNQGPRRSGVKPKPQEWIESAAEEISRQLEVDEVLSSDARAHQKEWIKAVIAEAHDAYCKDSPSESSPPLAGDAPGTTSEAARCHPTASREYLDDPETWRGIGEPANCKEGQEVMQIAGPEQSVPRSEPTIDRPGDASGQTRAGTVTEGVGAAPPKCPECHHPLTGIDGKCSVEGCECEADRLVRKSGAELDDFRTTLEEELVRELHNFNPWTHGKYPMAMEILADKLIDERMKLRADLVEREAPQRPAILNAWLNPENHFEPDPQRDALVEYILKLEGRK